MAIINFNAREVEPSTGIDPIPAGKYQAIIINSDMKQTKMGGGEYLELEFEIISGQYKDRHLWTRLNLKNPHPDAVKFARADLSAICRSVNVIQPTDSIELHNLPLTITVRCRKNQDDEIVNEIRGYAPATSNICGTPPTITPARESAEQTTPSQLPPWVRK